MISLVKHFFFIFIFFKFNENERYFQFSKKILVFGIAKSVLILKSNLFSKLSKYFGIRENNSLFENLKTFFLVL